MRVASVLPHRRRVLVRALLLKAVLEAGEVAVDLEESHQRRGDQKQCWDGPGRTQGSLDTQDPVGDGGTVRNVLGEVQVKVLHKTTVRTYVHETVRVGNKERAHKVR